MVFKDQKRKNGRVPKLTDFLLLCVLKSDFFFPRRVPPTNGGDPWEMVWARQVQTIGCKRPYIEYGDVDTGSHQRKGECSPFSQGVWWQKLNGFKQNSKYGNCCTETSKSRPNGGKRNQHEIQPYSMFISVSCHLRNFKHAYSKMNYNIIYIYIYV